MIAQYNKDKKCNKMSALECRISIYCQKQKENKEKKENTFDGEWCLNFVPAMILWTEQHGLMVKVVWFMKMEVYLYEYVDGFMVNLLWFKGECSMVL